MPATWRRGRWSLSDRNRRGSQDASEHPGPEQRKTDIWHALQAWHAQASFDWPELTPEEVDAWRDRRPGREFVWPE